MKYPLGTKLRRPFENIKNWSLYAVVDSYSHEEGGRNPEYILRWHYTKTDTETSRNKWTESGITQQLEVWGMDKPKVMLDEELFKL